jgi:cytochrome P450
MASADPPVHTVHRRAVFPELVAQRMVTLEEEMTELARGLVRDFTTAGGGDFMPAVGNALPIAIISRLIAFRDSDLDALLDAAFASTLMVAVTFTLEELAQLVERSQGISTWIGEQLEIGGAPDDALLSTIARGIANGDLSTQGWHFDPAQPAQRRRGIDHEPDRQRGAHPRRTAVAPG